MRKNCSRIPSVSPSLTSLQCAVTSGTLAVGATNIPAPASPKTFIHIRRDPQTGEVILSRKPIMWEGFFAALKEAKLPADFLAAEARRQDAQDRDPLDGWKE